MQNSDISDLKIKFKKNLNCLARAIYSPPQTSKPEILAYWGPEAWSTDKWKKNQQPWPDLDQTRIGGCSLGSLWRGVGRLITKIKCISGSFRPFPDFFWTLTVAWLPTCSFLPIMLLWQTISRLSHICYRVATCSPMLFLWQTISRLSHMLPPMARRPPYWLLCDEQASLLCMLSLCKQWRQGIFSLVATSWQ